MSNRTCKNMNEKPYSQDKGIVSIHYVRTLTSEKILKTRTVSWNGWTGCGYMILASEKMLDTRMLRCYLVKKADKSHINMMHND